jgi:hypothetical protein
LQSCAGGAVEGHPPPPYRLAVALAHGWLHGGCTTLRRRLSDQCAHARSGLGGRLQSTPAPGGNSGARSRRCHRQRPTHTTPEAAWPPRSRPPAGSGPNSPRRSPLARSASAYAFMRKDGSRPQVWRLATLLQPHAAPQSQRQRPRRIPATTRIPARASGGCGYAGTGGYHGRSVGATASVMTNITRWPQVGTRRGLRGLFLVFRRIRAQTG